MSKFINFTPFDQQFQSKCSAVLDIKFTFILTFDHSIHKILNYSVCNFGRLNNEMDNKKGKTSSKADSPKITVVGLVPDRSDQPSNEFASGTRKTYYNKEEDHGSFVITPEERASYKTWFDNRQKSKKM